jgi:hypothetical protein
MSALAVAALCVRGLPGNAKNATELASSNRYRCVVRERLRGRAAGVEHFVS